MAKLLTFIFLTSISMLCCAHTATINAGTTIKTRTAEAIDSKIRKTGYQFRLTIDSDVQLDGKTLIKSGSKAQAIITKIQPSGKNLDEAVIVVELTTVRINNRLVSTPSFPIAGKAKSHKRKVVGEIDNDRYVVTGPNGEKMTADIPVVTKGYDLVVNEGSVLYFILKEPINL